MPPSLLFRPPLLCPRRPRSRGLSGIGRDNREKPDTEVVKAVRFASGAGLTTRREKAMIRYSRMVAALGAAALGLLVVAASPSEPAYEPQRVVAAFEGGTLDLSADWGEARACLVWDEAVDVPECFRTEAEMNARIVQLGKR